MKRATKDHYKILGISFNANLEEIKKAYRKRAFELHPDLNPNNPEASKEFQLLNEAYVTLIAVHTEDEKVKTKAHTAYKTKTEPSWSQKKAEEAKEPPKAEQKETQKEKAHTAHKKAEETKTQQASAQHNEKKAETKKSNEFFKEQIRPETHKRTYSKAQEAEDLRKKASSAYQAEGQKAQSRIYEPGAQPEEYEKPSQEEVLKNILNDPFARRVYEDIYSQIKSQSKNQEKSEKKEQKNILIDWSKSKVEPKDTNGFTGQVKTWLLKQIDDTLEYRLPMASLFPGSRIRLQISQGLSKDLRTVDITLPTDFVVGRPVRLKGLGKKLGKWQGDLYLTLLPLLPKS